MAHCSLCGDSFDDSRMLDHLRVLHPDVYVEDSPEKWPDGEFVVIDLTSLEPEEPS